MIGQSDYLWGPSTIHSMELLNGKGNTLSSQEVLTFKKKNAKDVWW
jgi:hypothetical protein